MVTSRQIFFNRVELKYLIDRTTRTALAKDIAAFMPPDTHTGTKGSYIVRSIYLDTPDYMAYHQKLAGSAIRHKLRVRSYGEDPSNPPFVRLEVKSKYLSIIHKITVDFPKDKFNEIMHAIKHRRMPPAHIFQNDGISKEFFRLQKQYNMMPQIYVQYRRQAWEHIQLDRVRINFDEDLIASRDLDLLKAPKSYRRLLKYNHVILEIKLDGGIPYWVHQLINKYNLQNQAVSKFCNAIRSEAYLSSVGRPNEQY